MPPSMGRDPMPSHPLSKLPTLALSSSLLVISNPSALAMAYPSDATD